MRGFEFGLRTGREVNLRGKSEQKSKEQLLLEARLERDARQRARLEQLSALHIQRVWRGSNVRSRTRARLRQDWTAAFGCGERADGCARTQPQVSTYLREFSPCHPHKASLTSCDIAANSKTPVSIIREIRDCCCWQECASFAVGLRPLAGVLRRLPGRSRHTLHSCRLPLHPLRRRR